MVFAGLAGANVLSQSAYLALAAVSTGYQTGIASSPQLNKTWRQASIISSMIGAFIVQQTGQNAVDDGTTATLLSQFTIAVQSVNRTRATTNVNLYVSPTGNDLNSGLSPTAAFQTLSAAYTKLLRTYDMNGFSPTLNLAAGNYAQGLAISGSLPGIGGNPLVVMGNNSSPSSVVINSTNTQVNTLSATNGAFLYVSGMTINSSGIGQGGNCLVAQSAGLINIGQGVVFGTAVSGHMVANFGGFIQASFNYSINGSAPSHIVTGQGGAINFDSLSPFTISVNNNPTFSSGAGFCFCGSGGTFATFNATFSGVATGLRYNCNTGGGISGVNGNVNFFPGNIAGISTTGYYG